LEKSQLEKRERDVAFLITIDIDGRIAYISPRIVDYLGYNYKELKGRSILDLVSPDVVPEFRKIVLGAFGGSRNINRFETKLVGKDGDLRYVELSGSVVTTMEKIQYNLFIFDVTREKKAEIALKESEEKFRVVAEASKAAIFMYDSDARLIYFNPQLEQITGYSGDQLRKMLVWDWVYPSDRAGVERIAMARLRHEPIQEQYETRYRIRTGEVRWIEHRGNVVEYQGRPAGLITALDITERKEAEEELARSNAQAELYLDLMAHDIANMNQIGTGFLELAIGSPRIGPEEKELLERTLDAFQNTSKLIQNVKKLRSGRAEGLKLEGICLSTALDRVKNDFSSAKGRDIAIQVSQNGDCRVVANELIHEVFGNLVGNSIKHSSPDRPLTIDIRSAPFTEDGVRYCRVTIEDNGPGIPDGQKKTLFTGSAKKSIKEKQRHGLGLMLVRSLIEDFKGRIEVEDRVPGDHTKGVRFIIRLPACE